MYGGPKGAWGFFLFLFHSMKSVNLIIFRFVDDTIRNISLHFKEDENLLLCNHSDWYSDWFLVPTRNLSCAQQKIKIPMSL